MERLNKIRERRKELLLTQEDLSKLTGITRTHIALIEKGKGNPRLKTLNKLAKALKVPTSYFFEKNV